MTECVRHPRDGRWTPVEDLTNELWAKQQVTSDAADANSQALAAQDVRLREAIARLDAKDAEILALKAAHEEDVASLLWDLAALQARVKALEPVVGPAYGVDVSGHQSITQVQAAAQDEKNTFLIVKATEGMGGRNADYTAQRAAAGSKFLGAYHFAWTAQDPLKEAENFLAYAMLKPGELVFLDAEKYNDTDPIDWAKSVNFCLTWLDTVKARTGVKPAVYLNWNWIKGLRTAATVAQWERLVEYPLWLAQWTKVPGQHDTVSPKTGSSKGWPIVLHQYDVDTLDRNYTADIAALKALA